MARAYYSTVFEQTAERIWEVIRDFNSYPRWVDGIDESFIEDGRPGDSVGCVRNFVYEGARIRQRLLAHSDKDRAFTFEMCEPHPMAVTNFVATVRVTPVVDGDRAFVEWWTTFECPPDQYEYWTAQFPRTDGFARWLKSLRARLSS